MGSRTERWDAVLAQPSRQDAATTRSMPDVPRQVKEVQKHIVKALAVPHSDAVDKLGLDVLREFRMKAFALMVIQSCVALVLAVVADLVVEAVGVPPDPKVFLSAAFLMVASLAGLCVVRLRYPWNYRVEVVFTVLAGVTIGLMTDPLQATQRAYFPDSREALKPQLYCMGFYTLGLCILSALSFVRYPPDGRMTRILPCAVVAVVVVDSLLCVTWATNKFCPGYWATMIAVLLSGALLWVGIENDRLAARLNPDEYLLPAILTWVDFFVLTMLMAASCCAGCILCGHCECAGADFGDCFAVGGLTGCCDFWLYGTNINMTKVQPMPGEAAAEGLAEDDEEPEVAGGNPPQQEMVF